MKGLPAIPASLLLAFATPAMAESLVASRAIPAQTVITAADLTLIDQKLPDALSDPSFAIGQETKLSIAAGRAIRDRDLAPATLVARNAKVTLIYAADGIHISVPGRALDRAAAGESLRVLNLATKTTVTGIVTGAGEVKVGG